MLRIQANKSDGRIVQHLGVNGFLIAMFLQQGARGQKSHIRGYDPGVECWHSQA